MKFSINDCLLPRLSFSPNGPLASNPNTELCGAALLQRSCGTNHHWPMAPVVVVQQLAKSSMVDNRGERGVEKVQLGGNSFPYGSIALRFRT